MYILFFRKDEKVKRHYFKMLKKEESKKVAAGNSNLEPLGEKGKIKKEDPVTARKMAAAFEARRKEAERKQKKVKKLHDILLRNARRICDLFWSGHFGFIHYFPLS